MRNCRPQDGVEDGIQPGGVVPAQIVRFLAHLRLLEGVPFSYLVADAELIPPETIRFFYLDRNATDALVQGALSVGTVNSADRVQLAQLYGTVRNEVDTAERLVRMKDSDAPAVDASGRPIGAGGPISGFVLRSRLVSGWPGLHVRAYATDTHPDDQTIPDMDTSPDRVRLLRMERLAPAVLLVLFDGVPKVVHIEEPRSGVQFGVQVVRRGSGAADGRPAGTRCHQAQQRFPQGGGNIRTVPVPFRPGSPGVINMKKLNEALVNIPEAHMHTPVLPAEFAMQMLRFPLRQVFGDTANIPPGTDAFVATVRSARSPNVSPWPPRCWSTDMPDVTPDEILKAAVTPRWSALTAIGGVSADLANYDRFLVREPRLLVPVDVQALVVRAGVNDTEGMIRLPFRNLTAEPPLDVHDDGQQRPPGVHLLWSVPAALGHGTVVDDPAAPGDATRRRLDLPVLPDRWACSGWPSRRSDGSTRHRLGDRGRCRDGHATDGLAELDGQHADRRRHAAHRGPTRHARRRHRPGCSATTRRPDGSRCTTR